MKIKWLTGMAALASITATGAAEGAVAKRFMFGRMPDGREVPAVTLANGRGMRVTLIAYGASIQSLILPDRAGRIADVALGYATLAEYLKVPQYFGATVGRYANRIARGRFTLDGHHHQTPVNNGANSLHGGTVGFDKRLWQVTEVHSGAVASVTMRLVSADGDQGYPGELTVDATYSLDGNDRLTIDYRARTSRATIVNITNHAYWNLGGEGSSAGAMAQRVAISGDRYMPTDAGAIPTGELRAVAGTAFDFRQPRAIGARVRDYRDEQLKLGRGYDHNWIVTDQPTPDVHVMACASDPASGRGFQLFSNQPGLQFYSGNFLDGTSHGKAGQAYREGDAFVMEPQIFPDTPNQPKFGSARLDPGQTYHNVIQYRFSASGQACGVSRS